MSLLSVSSYRIFYLAYQIKFYYYILVNGSFSFPFLFFIGPDIPSVAIYSTEDKQSECCASTPQCTILWTEHTVNIFSLRNLSLRDSNKGPAFSCAAEVFDVETNEKVNDTYNNMQMPRVENETITIDDYSTCPLPGWITKYKITCQSAFIIRLPLTPFCPL